MSRRFRLLLGISSTVGVTLLLAWILVQALVVRPAIAEREPARVVQVGEAAELLREGVDKEEVEESLGIDVRILLGRAEGPPPGEGWIRLDTGETTLWKREGGNYELAAWTGRAWVVLQEHPPHRVTLALAFVAAGFPIVALIFGIGERTSRTQERLEAALSRMAEGKLDERLDERVGSRDQRRLAASLNRMATQLQALIDSDRQQMAGLSHELRTPLTRIRLELELARREGASVQRLERVERDIEFFDDLLTEMLDLSRLQMVGGQLLEREVVDLAGLAQLVVEEDEWGDVEVRGEGTAEVDPGLVARLIRNLLRNSAQHAPGSARWVEVSDDVLAVGDDGPGLSAERRDRALDAFQRGESSDGHGLGLAIVAQIVALHGGALSLSPPPGLVVRAEFGRGGGRGPSSP